MSHGVPHGRTRPLRVLVGALEGLAGALLLALVAVTVVDVIGRYLLNAPLAGAFELTQLTLCALVFAALPLVSRSGGHVGVDLLVEALPPLARRIAAVLAATVSAVVLLYFAWRLGLLAARQWEDGARSVALGVPFAPFAALGAAGCALAAGLGVLRELGAREAGA